jgi:long-chain alkane monooxygenase
MPDLTSPRPNLINAEIPGTYEDFVEHVAPVLQRRGLMQSQYAPGTLRNKLFGRGDRLPDRHPAARYRGAFAARQAAGATR